MEKLFKWRREIIIALVFALSTVDTTALISWPGSCVVCTLSAFAHALLLLAARTHERQDASPQSRAFIRGVSLHQLSLSILYAIRAASSAFMHTHPERADIQTLALSWSEMCLGVAVILALYEVIPHASPEPAQITVVRFLRRSERAVISGVLALAACSSLLISFGWRARHERLWFFTSGGLSAASCCAIAIYVWVLMKGAGFRKENGKWWLVITAGCVISAVLQPWHSYMIHSSLTDVYFLLLLPPRLALMWATYNRIVSLSSPGSVAPRRPARPVSRTR